jgi:hypothetical protein
MATQPKKILPVRIGMPSTKLNPFDRYLANAIANWPEPALVRFAGECQIDLDSTVPLYTQEPGDKWIAVKDLSQAQSDQETDFYHTVAVWHSQNQIMTEEWGMELDTGDYYRLFYCFDQKKITLVDSVSWKIALENDPAKDTGWGYEHRWKLGQDGKFATTLKQFVDLREKPIASPQLDEETKEGLDAEDVGIHSWADLQLPDALLH